MKKVFLAIAVVAVFTACNNGGETPAATTDSTAKVIDSTVKVADSTVKAVKDSIKK